MKKTIAVLITLLLVGYTLTGCNTIASVDAEPAQGEGARPAKQLPTPLSDEDAQEGDDGNYLYTDQAAFCGYWHASPEIGSGYSARYLLDVDGTFIYGCSEMDGLDRMRYASGHWYTDGNKLCLEIWERVVWEGGKEATTDFTVATSRMIDDPAVRHIGYEEAELETRDIAEAKPDAETGKRVITIDGVAFYSFDEQTDLLDGFWDMKALADDPNNEQDSDHATGVWDEAIEDCLISLHSVKGRLAPDMPQWEFELYGRKSDDQSYYEIIVLSIFDENGRIVDSDEAMCTNGTVNEPHILLADANFDGYMDALYTEGGVGAHEHIWYNLRLWDPGSKAFRPGEGFGEICNPVMDKKENVIRSCGAGSATEDIYSVYVYKNGRYYPDKELVLTFDDVNGVEHRTYEVYSYETGKAKLIKKTRGSGMPDPSKPGEADFWGPKSEWKLDDPIWYQSRHYQGSDE